MISRRAVVLGGLGMPVMAWAHEGHNHLPVTVSAEAVRKRSGAVVVTLTFFNTSTAAATLGAVRVEGGTMEGFAPVVVPAGDIVEAKITLRFDSAVPSVIPLHLDFGTRGSGSVSATF